jgi:23S rRNA pseudouridine1911/1915/1917 synthase
VVAGAERQPPFTVEVGEGESGDRLDRFLAGRLGSRARAARLIEAGLVSVDGALAPKRQLVESGQRIEVARPTRPVDPGSGEAAPYGVAYEDEHLLIVDKPAGVVVHPARGHRTGTLAQALVGRAAGGEDAERAGIVHRLDRDTSGLLVVARSDAVLRSLKAMLAAREIHREYLAMVDGLPSARTGTIDAPVGRDPRDRVLMAVGGHGGREARTHFEVVEAVAGASLLRILLDTGRTHQIRVHMAAIGHPILGDRQYGGPRRLGLERQFLHAGRLTFRHPVTGAPLDAGSPLPADLERALTLARTS